MDKNKGENKGRSRDASPRNDPGKKRRERSVTPRPLRIHIGRLTRNVTREHVVEIFSYFGEIKSVDFPMDRINRVGRGHCYVDYTNPDHAELAMKNMDGGQIDGQEISAAPILVPKTRPQQQMRRMSPMRGGGMGGGGRQMNNRWRNNSPNRFRRRSPPRRNNSPRRRNRSRSPINRRRNRRSSSGSSR